MADDKNDAKKAPLSVKKPEVAGEEDQTVKIEKPIIKPKMKPVVDIGKADDAVPLKPKDADEEKTAKLPKLPKPGASKLELEEDDAEATISMDKNEVMPLKQPGEDDQTSKVPKPGAPKAADEEEDAEATISLDKDEVVPLKKPNAGEEDQTAKIPKPSKMGEEKKVVLNSATESTIRPSDATTMAPSVVPENIDMRKTESGNVEVDDGLSVAKPDVGGAASTPAPTATPAGETKGRKTIKLKPLKKDAPPEEDENAEETISMDRSQLMEDEKNMPSLGGAAPTKEAAAVPDENLEDEATVKIQKPTISKPAHPTPVVPGSKETIKLRPSTTPPPPGAAGAAVTKTEPAAASAAGDVDASVSKKTIRLVPKKPGEDDATQKTPKPVGAGAPAGGGAKPSAPTVKMQEPDDVTQKTARPSAPTVKMPEPPADGGVAAVPPASGAKPSASKKTLKLKATSPAAPPPQAAGAPDGSGMPPADAPVAAAGGGGGAPAPKAAKGADPGVVLTLVAVLTLIFMAYFVWMVAGQWAEQYQEVESANVPALSGSVPNPR